MYDEPAGAAGESGHLSGEALADPVLPRLTEELLAAYLGTEVVDGGGSVWSGPGAVADLADTWVITADNPFSALRDPRENDAANARLRATVAAAGFAATPLVGRAPDLSWSEDCIGVRGPSLDEICAWGRAYGQHAVFLLKQRTHAVVSCWSEEQLGSRPRVLVDPHPFGVTPIRDIM